MLKRKVRELLYGSSDEMGMGKMGGRLHSFSYANDLDFICESEEDVRVMVERLGEEV